MSSRCTKQKQQRKMAAQGLKNSQHSCKPKGPPLRQAHLNENDYKYQNSSEFFAALRQNTIAFEQAALNE